MELEASRLKKQKTLNAELVTNIREAKALEKAEELELANFKKQLRDAEAVSEEDKRALELLKIEEHYQALIDKAIENDIATTELEDALRLAKEEKQAGFDEADAKKEKEIDDKIKADEEKKLAHLQEIEAQKIAARENTFNTAIRLAGEESRLGKAMLVAKTILAAKENIMEIRKTLVKAQQASVEATIDGAKSGSAVAQGAAETSKIGFPQNIPLLIAYAAQAIGIISAVKQAVGKTKKAASMAGASSGGSVNIETPKIETTPAAASHTPSFSTGGASEVKQLAEGLGGRQQQDRA